MKCRRAAANRTLTVATKSWRQVAVLGLVSALGVWGEGKADDMGDSQTNSATHYEMPTGRAEVGARPVEPREAPRPRIPVGADELARLKALAGTRLDDASPGSDPSTATTTVPRR